MADDPADAGGFQLSVAVSEELLVLNVRPAGTPGTTGVCTAMSAGMSTVVSTVTCGPPLAGISTTRSSKVSDTYTFSALSTATPSGRSSPVPTVLVVPVPAA